MVGACRWGVCALMHTALGEPVNREPVEAGAGVPTPRLRAMAAYRQRVSSGLEESAVMFTTAQW